jgi:hypothetical protein
MLNAPDKTRKAYLDAESFGNQLTRLLPPLAAAATLARGIDIHPGNKLIALPLCIATDGHKRRDIWKAWDTQGARCGHWSALHRAGITIRAWPARPTPRRISPRYAHRTVLRQMPGKPTGILESYSFDPETDAEPIDPYKPESRPKRVVIA